MFIFVPVNFFSIWVIEKIGLRTSINLGVSFQLVGFWVRYFVFVDFKLLLVG